MLNIVNSQFSAAACKSIEKEINKSIEISATKPLELALDAMKKDIPRLKYNIEGCNANSLERFLHMSSLNPNTKWVEDNIVALSFCHQGLYQIVMDAIKIEYRSSKIQSVGLAGGHSIVMFDFFRKQGKCFITLSISGKISAMVAPDNIYEADRRKSSIDFLLTLEFNPPSNKFWVRKHASVTVPKQIGFNQYSINFVDSDD